MLWLDCNTTILLVKYYNDLLRKIHIIKKITFTFNL